MWSALAAAVGGPRSSASTASRTPMFVAQRVGPGLERPGARDLRPDLERERRADHALRLRARRRPPWCPTRARSRPRPASPGAARRVELPARTSRRRARTAGSGPRARPTTAQRAAAPAALARRAAPTRAASAVGVDSGWRSSRLGAAAGASSASSARTGRRDARRGLGRGRSPRSRPWRSSHDCRITAAAAASMSSRWLARRLLRRRVGLSEVALGDHRGEPLIVGVDLDPSARASSPQRLDLVEHRPRGRARARPSSERGSPTTISWRAELPRGGDDGAVVVGDVAAARRASRAGWRACPDGSEAARPMRRDAEIDAEDAAHAGRRVAARSAATAASRSAERVVDRADVRAAALHDARRSSPCRRRAPSPRRARCRPPTRPPSTRSLRDRDREPGLGAVGRRARRARRSRDPSASRVAIASVAEVVGASSPSRRTTTTPSTAAAASVAASAPACCDRSAAELVLRAAFTCSSEPLDAVGQLRRARPAACRRARAAAPLRRGCARARRRR